MLQPVKATPPPTITVPLLDLRGQYQTLAGEIMPVLQRLCATQQFILGRYVTEFEQAAALYCRCNATIGVSSGTDALLLALMALGVGAGDEVVTSPYSFFATAGTIARVGARPVFCDVEAQSLNLDPRAVAAFLYDRCERQGDVLINRSTGGRVRALMPVHLYGQCADMASLSQLAHEFGLKIIEDAAQAIGADDVDGRRAGSMSDIGCLSFFPTKNLGAFGDAGMCTVQDADLAEHLRVLRVHGGKPKYHHSFIGGNFRLDELLGIKLKYLDQWSDARARNASFYAAAFERAGLSAQVTLPAQKPGSRHIWNQYVIRAPRRDALKDFLAQQGVATEIYYPVPLHRQPCFAYLGYRDGDMPVAEAAAMATLALPIYPELTEQQLQYVVDAVGKFYTTTCS